MVKLRLAGGVRQSLVGGFTAFSLGCASGFQGAEPSTVPPIGSQTGPGAADDVETTLLLVGDAGWAASDDPVLARVAAHASQRPDRTVVVFLGDNVYPGGMPTVGSEQRGRAEDILLAQLQVGRGGAQTIFVPGNHDWDDSGVGGWDEILEEGRFLEANGSELLPAGGCPGPGVLDTGSQVRLIALDTQWWLHDHAKPTDPNSDCETDSETEVLHAFGDALATAGGRRVVVIAHHPLVSRGVHAGHFTWKDHIFPLRHLASWLWLPLPIVGSLYPLIRGFGVTDQDLSNGENRHMRAALDSVMAIHRPLAFAGGHDHSLQVLEGQTARYFLVSGASTIGHSTPV
ncbi:MAG: metallophosphoesterase, partial [Acidimicrobiia bacterium]